MSEQVTTIPKINRDAKISIVLDYNDAGAVATGVYLISKYWKDYQPSKMDELKSLLESKGKIEDIEMHTLLILDQLYKRIVAAAKEQSCTTEIPLTEAFSPI